jgi:hypothetical protein
MFDSFPHSLENLIQIFFCKIDDILNLFGIEPTLILLHAKEPSINITRCLLIGLQP